MQDTSLGNTPKLSAALQPIADTLHSMRVPVDGNPVPPVPDTNEIDWSCDDGPEPDYTFNPKPQPAINVQDLKVIVFDLYGSLFVSFKSLSKCISLIHL